MKLSTIAALTVVALRCVTLFLYCGRIVRKQVSPPPSTWAIFTLAPTIALMAYVADGGVLIGAANIGNLIDPLANALTLVLIWRYSGKAWQPTKLEKRCFVVGSVILVLWAATGQHVAANLLLKSLVSDDPPFGTDPEKWPDHGTADSR